MKQTVKIIVSAVVGTVIFSFLLNSCQRIDAGHAGIKVNLYGNGKGVQDVTEVTGMVWYNPFTTKVYEIPTFVQNAVYTAADDDGSRQNEEFRVTTKDGLVAAFDVSINYSTPQGNIVGIFKKYRRPISELSKTVVRNYLREAFNLTASSFTAEMLYEKRAIYEALSDSAIRSILEPEGFLIEQVVILNELRLPDAVVHNINEKVSATQIAMKKQQEVAQTRADAEKRIEEARGYAESEKIKADADRYVYEQKRATLNELLIQQMFLEKWDGKLPVYGTTPTIFKDITR